MKIKGVIEDLNFFFNLKITIVKIQNKITKNNLKYI